jgi:hypothetical protein
MNARATTLSRPLMLLAAIAALALSMLYITSPVNAATKNTICHANSGVKEFVAITVDEGAALSPHLDDNGSPLNGHEGDFLLEGEQTAQDCFDAAHSASPSPSEEESVAESVAESAEASGEQSVEAGTGTPEESVTDGALFGIGGSPLPTIAFSLILLASLGGLAYANVRTVRNRI